jgi:hypothetical protein
MSVHAGPEMHIDMLLVTQSAHKSNSKQCPVSSKQLLPKHQQGVTSDQRPNMCLCHSQCYRECAQCGAPTPQQFRQGQQWAMPCLL